MQLFGIGNALLYYRLKYELPQEAVCEGICPAATLSRIEAGNREFDSLITEALIGRLGKTVYKYEFVLDDIDYKFYSMRLQIEKYLDYMKLDEAEMLISYYRKQLKKEVKYDKLHQQFLFYQQFIIAEKRGNARDQLIAFLRKAIQLTCPDYKDHVTEKMLFSGMEGKIIYQLYLLHEYGEKELRPLIRFMETYYDDEQKEASLFPIYLRLVKDYEQQERYHDIIGTCEKAIKIKCTGRSFHHLADLYFSQVKAKYYLKHEIENLREMCNHIYYVYMIDENSEGMKHVDHFCREELKCPITEQEML